MAVNENEPVKCKDCSVWWRGLEHACKTGPTKSENPPATRKTYDKTKDFYGCPLCGAKGPHYCMGKRSTAQGFGKGIWPDYSSNFCYECGNYWSRNEPHFCKKSKYK